MPPWAAGLLGLLVGSACVAVGLIAAAVADRIMRPVRAGTTVAVAQELRRWQLRFLAALMETDPAEEPLAVVEAMSHRITELSSKANR